MIFHFKAAQNLVAKHNESDFEMIFYLNAAQNLVVEQYKRDFLTWFYTLKRVKTWLQITMKEIFYMIFHFN